MTAIDSPHGVFKMTAIREVLRQVSATPAIEAQIDALEESVGTNHAFACDLSKAIVESTCKIILEDRGVKPDSKWDAPKLLKETMNLLPLAGTTGDAAKKANDAVRKTVTGQLQTIQGLCEIRNTFGLASHGKGRELPRLGDYQVLYAAQAADAVIAFLYRVHRTSLESVPAQHTYYEDYSDFNDSLDEVCMDQYGEIKIGSFLMVPSRVLHHFDIIGYRDALTDYLEQSKDNEDDEQEDVQEEDGA